MVKYQVDSVKMTNFSVLSLKLGNPEIVSKITPKIDHKIVVEIVPEMIQKNVYEIVYRSPQSYQHYFQCKDDKLWINIK